MPIPESQLESWSNQGATVTAANTHSSLKRALAEHEWPEGMTYESYIQGSYANATNIRGTSDVDLVVESSAVYYSNLTEEEKRARGLQKGRFSWSDFRDEVFEALINHYGARNVVLGDKSIKVAPNSERLAADVVPCITYKEYKNGKLYAEGMTFWTSRDLQIKNFPKHHKKNGSAKNSDNRTAGWYKPSVRMFKNARERLIADHGMERERAPSYFVECLIFNALDSDFGESYQNTYSNAVNRLLERVADATDKLVCQNYKRWLFGSDFTQWNRADAAYFLDSLIDLWNEW